MYSKVLLLSWHLLHLSSVRRTLCRVYSENLQYCNYIYHYSNVKKACINSFSVYRWKFNLTFLFKTGTTTFFSKIDASEGNTIAFFRFLMLIVKSIIEKLEMLSGNRKGCWANLNLWNFPNAQITIKMKKQIKISLCSILIQSSFAFQLDPFLYTTTIFSNIGKSWRSINQREWGIWQII